MLREPISWLIDQWSGLISDISSNLNNSVVLMLQSCCKKSAQNWSSLCKQPVLKSKGTPDRLCLSTNWSLNWLSQHSICITRAALIATRSRRNVEHSKGWECGRAELIPSGPERGVSFWESSHRGLRGFPELPGWWGPLVPPQIHVEKVGKEGLIQRPGKIPKGIYLLIFIFQFFLDFNRGM